MYFGMRLRDRGDEASPDPEIAALLDYAKSPYPTLPYPAVPYRDSPLIFGPQVRGEVPGHQPRPVSHGGHELLRHQSRYRRTGGQGVPALSGGGRGAMPWGMYQSAAFGR